MDQSDIRVGVPEGGAPAFVVGVGVSAGGLESLEQMFRGMPPRTGMAFVIIQHLSPDFRSLMDELLARFTTIPIESATDGMPVRPDHIYLLPPRKEMTIERGLLRLTDKDLGRGLTLPIDTFFRSLAEDAGTRAIAIILSGTGTDGSRGLRDVHHAGGLVLCESEETARFDGMPLAAQETGFVDKVLTAEDVAATLTAYARSPNEWREAQKSAGSEPTEVGREAILQLLRAEYDIDFSHYKPSTVNRRIDRRIAMNRDQNLEGYVERLRNDSAELNALYKDLLIGVTRFFRDVECFQRLEKAILPTLLERTRPEDELRVWVAACATGEEAYSMAILLYEQLEERGRPVNMKVFATDVHRTSLDFASQGIYDETRLMDVSPARLKRFFVHKRDGYHVSQDLREHVVFAPHNLLKDAPFTNLDLVSCRNLLIYFQPNAQRKALSLFHYGLKVGGFLFLGTSESASDLGSEFESVDDHSRLYRKRRDVRLMKDMRLPLPSRQVRPSQLPQARSGPYPDSLMLSTYDRLLDRFMPPSLLVDENRELLDVFGGAEKLLRIRRRRPSTDVMNLLADDAKLVVAGALQRAMAQQQPIRFSGVRLQSEEGERAWHVSVEPVRNSAANVIHYVILFEPMGPALPAPVPASSLDAGTLPADRVEGLEEELRYAREHLQATIEELETSNEELQATNEELIASNEELQSTNEELHSVNEELYSVNAEHQRKISELHELNQDMNALLESTEVGTVFLDRELYVRKFTPRVAEVFHLLPQDVGRKLSTFAHELDYTGLHEDLQRALTSSTRVEREVYTHRGVPLLLRILPYRIGRTPDRVEGVVLTVTDISGVIAARERVEQLSRIVESSTDAIIGLDPQGRVTSWNGGASRMYGYTPEEAITKDMSFLFPEDRRSEAENIRHRLASGQPWTEYETMRLRKDGTTVEVSTTQSPVLGARGQHLGGSTIDRDVSARRTAEGLLRASEKKYEDLFTHAPDMYLTVDVRSGRVVEANETFFRMTGLMHEQTVGREFVQLFTADEAAPAAFRHFRSSGQLHDAELQLRRHDDTWLDVAVSATALRDDQNEIVRCRAVLRDITARKQAEAKIRDAVVLRERFLAMLSHELRNPMHAVRSASAVVTDAKSSAAQVKAAHAVMDRQTSHMSRLLDDLLDVARITQNRIELRRQKVDARDVVADAVMATRPLFERAGVQLKVDVVEGALPADVDPTRLVQSISNVLSNAAKFSPPGGHVWTRLFTEGSECVVQVRDEGIGLSPQMISKVFDLFVQGEQPLDRAMGGLGIGLTVARSLVELHGGSLRARSEGPGRGSEFEIRFPLSSAGRSVQEPPYAPVRTRSIVIVEDQPDNREMLKLLLELAGYDVRIAADGEEGLKIILEDPPDVALIDIGLPRINGYELARRIRKVLPPEATYLVAVTGYGQGRDLLEAQQAGFDEHLVKPINAQALQQLLEDRGRGATSVPSVERPGWLERTGSN